MMRSADIAEAVVNRAAHIGIGRPPSGDANMVSLPLWEHAILAVLPANQRLAGEREIDLARLTGDVLILQHRSVIGTTYDRLIALAHDRGFVLECIEERALPHRSIPIRVTPSITPCRSWSAWTA